MPSTPVGEPFGITASSNGLSSAELISLQELTCGRLRSVRHILDVSDGRARYTYIIAHKRTPCVQLYVTATM